MSEGAIKYDTTIGRNDTQTEPPSDNGLMGICK